MWSELYHPLNMWLSASPQAPHKSYAISFFPSWSPSLSNRSWHPIKHKNNSSRRPCSSSFVYGSLSLNAPSLNLVYSRLRSHQVLCTSPRPWLGSSLLAAQCIMLKWTQLHPTQLSTPAEHSSRHVSPLPCVYTQVLSVVRVYLDSAGVPICSDIRHRPS